MADNNRKIPAWQRKDTDKPTQEASQIQDASPSVIDQVREFLQDAQVKDAPAEKKRAFLLSKNVSEHVIDQVMTSDASSTPADTDGSTEAAKQEYDASRKAPRAPSYTKTTDGSEDAAKQEYDASKKFPQGPSYVQTTDGSQNAANQEYEASKRIPQSPSNTSTTDGSTEAATQEYDASKKTPQGPSYIKTTDGSEEAANQEFEASKAAPTPSITFSAAEFRATNPSNTATQQPRRDVPPIITYPEFLVQPQKPPPLVTVNRLVNTAYVAGALTATIYALSKYIIAPMSENLNEARHDLAQHTNDHVQNFNERLSKLVSTIPPSAKSSTLTPDDSDAESIFSDPTELFHRDIGTQTSPSLSRRTSLSSSDGEPGKSEAVVLKHTSRLNTLRSHLSNILSDDEDNGTINQSLQNGIGEVRHYVDSLYYSPPVYQYQQADSAWNSQSTTKSDKPDAAAAFKAEIRGVKGVLLSAKRFPSAGKAGA